jgi:hypothetical protein
VGLGLSYRMGFGSRSRVLQAGVFPRFAFAYFFVTLSAVALVALSREWHLAYYAIRYHLIFLQVIFGVVVLLLSYISTQQWRIETKHLAYAALGTVMIIVSIPNLQVGARYGSLGSQAFEQLKCTRAFFAGTHPESCDGGPFDWGWPQNHISNAAKLGAHYCYLVAEGIAPTDDIDACYVVLQAKRPH